MLKDEKGFTLIEMLIVLLVISVLIILFVPNLSGRGKEVSDKGCDALVTVVQSQVNLYQMEKGSYPIDLSQLVREDYIKKDQTKCHQKGNLTYDSATGKVGDPK